MGNDIDMGKHVSRCLRNPRAKDVSRKRPKNGASGASGASGKGGPQCPLCALPFADVESLTKHIDRCLRRPGQEEAGGKGGKGQNKKARRSKGVAGAAAGKGSTT